MHLKCEIPLITGLLLFLCHTSHAAGIWEVGIEVGPNYGYIEYDDVLPGEDPQWNWGFTGGLHISIPLAPQFLIAPGLRYSHLENQVEMSRQVAMGISSIEHNSLSFLLLLRYEFHEKVFFIDLGPEFALMLSSKKHNDYDAWIYGYQKETLDISDRVKDYNLGACARIGFRAHRWNVPLAMCISYHHGLIDMAKEGEWWTNWKTRELSICLSYVYQFGN